MAANVFWSAALLLLCSFISRCLGFAYKIILVRLLGPEGVGITELVAPVYSFALVAASLGVPMALSRRLSQEIGRRRYQLLPRLQNTSLLLLALLGGAVALACFLLSPSLLSHLTQEPRALAYFRAITPAILLVSVCSGFRAYFQATKQIGVIGLSQNIEQLVRVLAGAALVTWLLPRGLEAALIGVAAATVAGELSGLLFIMGRYLRQRPRYAAPPNSPLPSPEPLPGFAQTSLSLLSFGAPVTVQRFISSAVLMLQAMLIPQALLASGLSQAQATAAYGSFSGVALALIHLPGIFTATLAMALLPAIAEIDNDRQQLCRRINQSLHITAAVSFPFMLLFYQYAEAICGWLFHAPQAAGPLRVLSLAGFFIYAQTALTSILQGMGKLTTLLVSLLFSGGVFLLAIRLLIPPLGLSGAALAYLLFAAAACLVDVLALRRYAGLRLDLPNICLKPSLAVLAGLFLPRALKKTAGLCCPTILSHMENFASLHLTGALGLLLGALAGSVIYLAVLCALGGFPSLLWRYIRPLLPRHTSSD